MRRAVRIRRSARQPHPPRRRPAGRINVAVPAGLSTVWDTPRWKTDPTLEPPCVPPWKGGSCNRNGGVGIGPVSPPGKRGVGTAAAEILPAIRRGSRRHGGASLPDVHRDGTRRRHGGARLWRTWPWHPTFFSCRDRVAGRSAKRPPKKTKTPDGLSRPVSPGGERSIVKSRGFADQLRYGGVTHFCQHGKRSAWRHPRHDGGHRNAIRSSVPCHEKGTSPRHKSVTHQLIIRPAGPRVSS